MRAVKRIEMRRHSLTGEDKNISAEGTALARRAKNTMQESYDRCYVSPKPRCGQTAEAFGCSDYIVDERFGLLPGEQLDPFDDKVEEAVNKGCSLLEAYLCVPETRSVLQDFGKSVVEAIKGVAQQLPEGGSALIVSHGGTIEPTAIAAKGGPFELCEIGGELSQCEGVVFIVEDEEIKDVAVVRSREEIAD